jgi:hypothetical protein
MVKVYSNKNMSTLCLIYQEIYKANSFDEAVDIVRNLCYYNTNKKIGRKVAIEIVTMYNNSTGLFD